MTTDTPEAPKRGRKPRTKPEPANQVNARGQALKDRRREAGLTRVELWIKPEHKPAAKEFERQHQ